MNINSWLLIVLIIQNFFYMSHLSSPFKEVTGHKSGIEEINYSLDRIDTSLDRIDKNLKEITDKQNEYR